MNGRHHPLAFTLIETMLAVVLMALLASAVSLSFAKPLQSARVQDAGQLIRSFDSSARQLAITSGRQVRIVFDLSSNTLLQQLGPDFSQTNRKVALPAGCEFSEVRIAETSTTAGPALIDFSPSGWSRTYSVHLVISASNQWLVFAGLSGQMTALQNESQIPTYSISARHDAD